VQQLRVLTSEREEAGRSIGHTWIFPNRSVVELPYCRAAHRTVGIVDRRITSNLRIAKELLCTSVYSSGYVP
jgi:hypothetical protein